MATELDRLARLAELFGTPAPPRLGVGDDAALVAPELRGVLASVDAAVEGVHFRRDLLDLATASERAVEAALSDIAAMGGDVQGPGSGILLAWTLPPALPEVDFDALAEGALRAARRAGTVVLGGNLARAPVLTLTTTVLGRPGDRVLTRAGARPGDALAVTGVVGAAALGLRCLLAGAAGREGAAACVARWRSPRARLVEGRAVAAEAHAAIDLSDGLALDGARLAAASGCALVLDVERLPMLPGQAALAGALGLDAVELALGGGEDYELLVAGPRACFGAGWTVVGEAREGAGIRVREGGRDRPLPRGFDHFGT